MDKKTSVCYEAPYTIWKTQNSLIRRLRVEFCMSQLVKPNTHRRRRRDETVLSRRVGVGGVYWA